MHLEEPSRRKLHMTLLRWDNRKINRKSKQKLTSWRINTCYAYCKSLIIVGKEESRLVIDWLFDISINVMEESKWIL